MVWMDEHLSSVSRGKGSSFVITFDLANFAIVPQKNFKGTKRHPNRKSTVWDILPHHRKRAAQNYLDSGLDNRQRGGFR